MYRFVAGRGRCARVVTLLMLAPSVLVSDVSSRRVEARPEAPREASAPAQETEPHVIEVTVRRYAFEPAEIEVIQGERVRLLVKSADGPHGFEIKPLKVSKEIPRGTEPVRIDFTPNEAGRFPVLCSVYCGDGHNDMKGALVVTARPAGQP